MNKITLLALASVSAAALGSAASAQSTSAQPTAAAAPAEEATLGEIVVTARRRSESLQEVPQTVNAVTADTLSKLNIKQFQDIQNVVPGLSLSPSQIGPQKNASLRGVTFDTNTGQVPTVAFYMNDAPVGLNFVYQSLFDVGQVEVLKGPQGTNRGVSAPSGAITVTTRKPDLSGFGGYVDTTLTDLQGRNVNAAVNVPIIKDVLGLRVSGVMDQNDYGGVRSLHNGTRPEAKTSGVRASLSFEPNDALNANVTYQHLDHRVMSFSQVTGPGPGSFTSGTTTFPATFNPPLTGEDRAAVQDSAEDTIQHYDVVTAQVDSRLFGQHFSYVGSYQFQKEHNLSEGPGDVGNVVPFVAIVQDTRTSAKETTQEFRIASDPAPGRFFDYTVGAYYDWFDVGGHVNNPGPLLAGAFGAAPGINLSAYNPAYQIPVFIDIPSTRQETSLFGNLTLHLGDNTELSGGVRHIWSIVNNQTTISTGNGLINLDALGLPAAVGCSALHFAQGAGARDCVVPAAGVRSNLQTRASESPTIYNVSLSHHFTRDFLVYANTGTSFRPPVASVGIQGALANSTLPGQDTLSFHPSEKSTAYEVGFKSSWLDGRARLNASIFRQKFTNLTIYIPNISYYNTITGQPTNFNFTQSVDALVQGFDIDTAFQITHDWNISAQMSYADGKIKSGMVPCNVAGAVLSPTNLISMCAGGSSSRLPLWNATFQTEYTRPVTDKVDGFVRGLLNYYPQNKNRAEPNFTVDAYSLLNVYAGVRSHDGAWEASIFARNAFNTYRELDVSTVQANTNGSLAQSFSSLIHPSGYYLTASTPQREVGINFHYAIGSR
jgi:iron complex outermembrane receptor protein